LPLGINQQVWADATNALPVWAVALFKQSNECKSCSNPTTATEKRELDEVEQLCLMNAHGGRLLGDVLPENNAYLKSDDRTTCSKGNLKEDTVFDGTAFDEFSALVLCRTDPGTNSFCSDVRAETKSMIPKIRALMHQQSKYQVDVFEAIKHCSNVFMWWLDDQLTGACAFIPNDKDRDVCIAALKIN